MARCLIIGCGCRGLSLAERLRADGHTVRGTTRDRGRVHAIEAAGVEPYVGDPDRVATLARALDHATVACVLLGSATGSPERLAALHGTRLDMLLSRMLDTTVRGIVYEASGTVEDAVLREGTRRVLAACEASMIPCALLEADPADPRGWLIDAHRAVTSLLAG